MNKHPYLTVILAFALIGAVILGIGFLSTGCSSNIGYNKQVADLNYKFTRAIIRFADGDMEVEIRSWCDYDDSDRIQITATNGTVYYTHGSNIILICDND